MIVHVGVVSVMCLRDILDVGQFFFFFSSRRRHTRCALVTGVQTCALPISRRTGYRVPSSISPSSSWWVPRDMVARYRVGSRMKRTEQPVFTQIGRASCRERVCQYV